LKCVPVKLRKIGAKKSDKPIPVVEIRKCSIERRISPFVRADFCHDSVGETEHKIRFPNGQPAALSELARVGVCTEFLAHSLA
jgi:hypothetical protein